MKFNVLIDKILNEDEISKEDKLSALKQLSDPTDSVRLVFTRASRYADEDSVGRVSVESPWRVITTTVDSGTFKKYFTYDKDYASHYQAEIKVLETNQTGGWASTKEEVSLVYAFWPKGEGKYWYDKTGLLRGESYLDEDNESEVVEPAEGWAREDEREWSGWVEDWVVEMD